MLKRLITLCTVLLTCTVFATLDPAAWFAKQEKLRRADDGVHETLSRLFKEEKTLSKEAQPLFDLYIAYQLSNYYDFSRNGTDESGPVDGWSRKTARAVLARYKARCITHFPYYATLPPYDLYTFKPLEDIPDLLRPTLLDHLSYRFDDEITWYTARITTAQTRNDALATIITRIDAIERNAPDPLASSTSPNDDDLIKRYPTVDLQPFSSSQRLILHLISEPLPPVAHAYVQYKVAMELLNDGGDSIYNQDAPDDILSHPNAVVALALLDKAQAVIKIPTILEDIKLRREKITRQEFDFETNTYWHPNTTLKITYRNLESVTLTFTPKGNTTVKPQAWTITLPKRPLYQEGHLTIPFPKTLTKGTYILTCDPDLRTYKGSAIEITVTDLAVTTLSEQRLLVLNAISGEPINGAVLMVKDKKVGTSDASGIISFTSLNLDTQNVPYAPYDLTYKDDTISGTIHRGYDFKDKLTRTVIQGHWFFDRGVYRPGQTVHYQVVFSQVNKMRDLYMSKETTGTITINSQIRDESKELAKIPFVSNKEGAYAGSFTIPADIDPCTLDFACQDVPNERNQCEVVFYKRPNFEITLDKPKVVAWGSPVSISGTAMTYNGIPLVDTNINTNINLNFSFRRGWGHEWGRRWEHGWGREWECEYKSWYDVKGELPPPVSMAMELKTDKTGRFTHTYTPTYPPSPSFA